VLLQVIPLPVAALRVLSPQRAAAVDALAPIGAGLRFASLSVAPGRTFRQFLLVSGYVVVFWTIHNVASRNPHRRWILVAPIIAIGTLEAALGVWQSLGLGLYQNFGGPGAPSRFGTYANHNHYAGFLEMALPFAVMYPVALLRRHGRDDHAAPARALAACGVWAAAGTMLLGIVFSLSRMGFVCTLFALLVAGVLALGRRQLGWVTHSRQRRWGAAAALAAIALASAALLPPDKLVLRFAKIASVQGLTAEGRIELWAETIPLIKAYPVFGCGLGGYETAFRRFKVAEPLLTDDYAHNDYLQLPAELGLAGCLILATLAFTVVRRTLRRSVAPYEQENRYLAVACAGALAAILLHSLADFNLYIPANAVLLAWIAGVSMADDAPGAGNYAGTREMALNLRTAEDMALRR
jgi:O-antigen ligase